VYVPACEEIVQAMRLQIGEPATQSGQQGRVTASVPIEYTASDGKTYRSYDTVCMPTGADVKSRSKLDKIKPKVHDDHASVSCTGRDRELKQCATSNVKVILTRIVEILHVTSWP